MSHRSKSTKVAVAVRLKPEARQVRRCAAADSMQPDKCIRVGEKRFEYDHVYDEDATQESIYQKSVASLVEGCFQGYNGTVFAYGQTGSGKTYSTMGLPNDSEDEGIIPRALRHIFSFLKSSHSDEEGKTTLFNLASVHVSYMEIYNEECRDLLHPDIPSRDIMIREDRDGRIFFTGARDEVVRSTEEAIHFLEMGNIQRTTAGTKMNATSSRSHAIFTVSLELLAYLARGEGKDCDGVEGALDNGKYIQSKLHLVDLAGSERAKRTGAAGKRLKESVGINQGLMTLGKVIRSLTVRRDADSEASPGGPNQKEAKQHVHVPYRESKLTRFLQDSLGGNSHTLMLACISPADVNAHETLSTLQYACRAKAVQNKAVANVKTAPMLRNGDNSEKSGGHMYDLQPVQEEVESSLVNALRLQLGRLQQEMQVLREERGAKGGNGGERIEGNALLRASIDSLYDSISAAPVVAGGALMDRPEGGGPSSPSSSSSSSSSRRLKATQLVLSDEIVPPLAALKGDLRIGLEQLEGHPAYFDDEHDDGVFWRLIEASRSGVGVLDATEDKLLLLSTNTTEEPLAKGTNIPGAPQSGVDFDPNAEIDRLRSELVEAREDLKSDEEVFKEKAKDMKRCRKQIRRLEEEKVALEEENQRVRQRLLKLEAAECDADDRRANESRPGTAGSTASGGFEVFYEEFPSSSRKTMEDEAEGEANAELSMAVLDTEPHISSLMDDLETIQQEKERLLEQNTDIGKRWDDAVAKAAQEKEMHSAKQVHLEKQLKQLEAGIKIKQQCITDLVHKEQQAQEEKENQTRKARELEATARRLSDQLRDLSQRQSSAVLSEREVAEERHKRVELQEQLDETKKLTKKLEKQLGRSRQEDKARREQESRTREMLGELTSLRNAHAKLQIELDSNQGKHRKDLDSLTAQVAAFRKAQQDSADHIKRLEARNSELTSRLARSAKQLKQRSIRNNNSNISASGSGGGSGGGGGGGDMDDLTVTSVFSHGARSLHSAPSGVSGGGVAFGSGTSRGGASLSGVRGHARREEGEAKHTSADEARRKGILHTQWLVGRLDDITSARLASAELSRLAAKIDELERDHAAGMAEYKALVAQQGEGESRLRGTLTDIDVKIRRLDDLAVNARQGGARWKELEAQKRALSEHRSEVQARLSKGVLHADKLNAMHDIAEELETIHAEMELNRVRLEEERRKVLKGPGAGANLYDNTEGGVNASASNKEAVALVQEMVERGVGEALLADSSGQTLQQSLSKLAMHAVEAKYCLSLARNDVREVRCRLDDKESEVEELQEVNTRLKNDHAHKLNELRRVSDEKVGALMRQLRVAETRSRDAEKTLRMSQEGPAVSAEARKQNATSSEAGGRAKFVPTASGYLSMEAPMPQVEMYQSFEASQEDDLSGRSSVRSSAQFRHKTDAALLRESIDSLESEVTERWSSEKERRVQLEKELRNLRSSIEKEGGRKSRK